MDRQIIQSFRDKVNEKDFVLFKYRDNNNKNLWNCICSAMDWIEVSVEYICRHPLRSVGPEQSIELYAYLASVDIIVEAVEQLHRVFFSTTKYVFSGDRECFYGNPFDETDRTHFKTIRACFGAHPVNLDDPEDPNNHEAKRFASWSGGFQNSNDFSVILYSNKIDGKDIWLGIHFDQINRFVEKYYSYLSELEKEIDAQYLRFCEEKRKQIFDFRGGELTQISILKQECKKRCDNDYFNSSLDQLLLIFQTPISCNANVEMVEQYRKSLRSLIEEMHSQLQNMVFPEWEYGWLLSPQPSNLPNGWGYWVSKLTDSVYGTGYPACVWYTSIERIFKGMFEFQFESQSELYVLVRAALYKASLE